MVSYVFLILFKSQKKKKKGFLLKHWYHLVADSNLSSINCRCKVTPVLSAEVSGDVCKHPVSGVKEFLCTEGESLAAVLGSPV